MYQEIGVRVRVRRHETTNKLLRVFSTVDPLQLINFQNYVATTLQIKQYVATILTSDRELILNTYMVTPTTTGGPEITIS